MQSAFTCSKGSVLCRFFCTHGLLSLCLNLDKLLLSVWRLGPTWSNRSLPAVVTERTCNLPWNYHGKCTRNLCTYMYVYDRARLFRVKEPLARLFAPHFVVYIILKPYLLLTNYIYMYNNKQQTLMGGTYKIERIKLGRHGIIFLPFTGTANVSRQITPTPREKSTIALMSVLDM